MRFDGTAPITYLITDGSFTDQNFERKVGSLLYLIKAAVAANIPLIQIREKGLSAQNLFRLSCIAVGSVTNSPTRILINDRLDVALSSGAHGVHLTSSSFKADVIRKFLSGDFVLGASTHSFEEAADAARKGANFVVFGPIFGTPGKPAPVGIESLSDIVSRLPATPVLAIGGIDDSNYQAVLDAGAAGFAAIRFLNNADNLAKLKSKC